MREPQNAKLSENTVIPRRAKPDVGISVINVFFYQEIATSLRSSQ